MTFAAGRSPATKGEREDSVHQPSCSAESPSAGTGDNDRGCFTRPART
jgi:hypothetical protein